MYTQEQAAWSEESICHTRGSSCPTGSAFGRCHMAFSQAKDPADPRELPYLLILEQRFQSAEKPGTGCVLQFIMNSESLPLCDCANVF